MVLHVMYKTFDGKRNDYLNEINKSQVLDLIRNEDGCISYNYYLLLIALFLYDNSF